MEETQRYTASGTVHVIKETRVISDRFSVREFVLDIDGKYPQTVQFQVTNQRLELIAGLNVGDQVDVYFNLRGREYVGRDGEVRHFNSLDVWRVENLSTRATPPVSPQGQTPPVSGGAGSAGGDNPFL